MKFTRYAIIIAVLGIGSTATLFAEEPDPIEILKKADAATRAVKACSYKAEFHAEGDFSSRVPRITGEFICRDARPGFFLKLMDKDEPGKPSFRAKVAVSMKPYGSDKIRHLDVSIDHKTVTFIDEDDKYWMQQDLPAAGPLLESAESLYMFEFLHPTPFSDEINAVKRKYEGEKEVEGVLCDVIYVKYNIHALEARWYFGREDSLPRRVERISRRLGTKNIRILTISDLDLSPELTAGHFRPPCPDGFERRVLVDPSRGEKLPVNRPAPEWALKTPDGKEVALKDLRGKVVVMSFWSTWCGYCKLSMPAIQSIHEKYADKPVKVTGVCCWDAQGDPAKYLASMNYTFSTVVDGDRVAKEYDVKGLPTYFVIDPDGNIVYARSGPLDQKELTAAIDKALAGLK